MVRRKATRAYPRGLTNRLPCRSPGHQCRPGDSAPFPAVRGENAPERHDLDPRRRQPASSEERCACSVSGRVRRACSPSPRRRAQPSSCGRAVIDDWYDNGRVDGTYALHCYDDAIDTLPRDVRDYSSAQGRHPARAPGAQARRAGTACDDRPDPRRRTARRRSDEDRRDGTTETTGDGTAERPGRSRPHRGGRRGRPRPTAPAPFRSRS